MTISGADPALVQRLAETQNRVRDTSAGIAERVREQSRAVTEAAEQRKEANARHSAELDRRAEERQGGKDDPAARNQWLQRTETRETTYRFGDDEPAAEASGPQPAPRSPEPLPPPQPPLPPREPVSRGRHAQRDPDFDDDDFSNNSWLT
ncbi:hypothetical protein B0I33_113153 [Prauserella shujinwangii]|uniref:Uncharacterized protein n=1 Tax=Prauserella shujinwangii TaxID=1453103 RepID=A0A2T0LLT1_9PSEU|nr:hypothetical protein [Prauserella shujinwangii]PRX43987.1 hypothetical protein B0I33_113153 [Prauserella shujinwangii]